MRAMAIQVAPHNNEPGPELFVAIPEIQLVG